MASRFIQALQGAVVALGLLTAGLAQATNDYFLQIDGIKGESTDRDHKDWIDITSFSWGLKLVTSSTGGGGASGKATFSDFTWTQLADSSTPSWFMAVATGRHVANATLDVTKSAGGASQSFFQMIFTDTIGTGLTLNGFNDITAQASMSSGATVTLRYRPQDDKGGFGDWVEGSFNIRTNSPNAVFSGDERVLLGLFQSGGFIDFDASAVTAVPEPASAALLLAGLGLLTLRRRVA